MNHKTIMIFRMVIFFLLMVVSGFILADLNYFG